MRARTLVLSGLLLGLISGSCYRPTYSNCTVRCRDFACPGALTCVNGLCTDGTQTCSNAVPEAGAGDTEVAETSLPDVPASSDLDVAIDADGGDVDWDAVESGDIDADASDLPKGELPGDIADLQLW